MRIAVISDVHSNLVALDAVLAAAGSVDATWHLGDVVGYGPEPDAVVERLTERGAVGVRGNHDAAATGGSEIDWFNPEAKAAMEWTRSHDLGDDEAWLEALPKKREVGGLTLVHGSPRDPTWEYVTTVSIARASLSAISTTARAARPHPRADRRSPTSTAGCGPSSRGPATAWRSTRAGCSSTRAASASRATATRGPSYLVLDLDAGTATWGRVALRHRRRRALDARGRPSRAARRTPPARAVSATA